MHFAAARQTGLAIALLLAIGGCAGSAGSTDAPCSDCGPSVAPPAPEGQGLTDVPLLDVAMSDDETSLSASLATATIRVRPGADTTLEVRVDRSAFEGEVAVWAEGLPAGLVAEPAVMPTSVPTGRLVIGATAAVSLGGPHPFTVVVSASGVEPMAVPARVVVAGAPGSLDETFGEGGIATFEGSVGVNAVTVDTRGRILLAGRDWDARAMFIERLRSDGSLDAAYGENARTVLPEGLRTNGTRMVMVGDDARLLMTAVEREGDADETQVGLLALTESGRPDDTIGGNGMVPAMVLASDSGSFALAEGAGTVFFRVGDRLAALRPGGEVIDLPLPEGARHSWGMAYANHTLTFGVNDLFDGAGPAMLERIHTAGGFDERFGSGGVARGVALPADGSGESVTFLVELLADGGAFAGANRWAEENGTVGELARFTRDGQLDGTFGEHGRVSFIDSAERMQGLVVDAQERPVVFTEHRPSFDHRLQRFTATGVVDRTFGEAGAIDLRTLGINGVRRVAHDPRADRVVACGQIAGGWGCARFWL